MEDLPRDDAPLGAAEAELEWGRDCGTEALLGDQATLNPRTVQLADGVDPDRDQQ